MSSWTGHVKAAVVVEVVDNVSFMMSQPVVDGVTGSSNSEQSLDLGFGNVV